MAPTSSPSWNARSSPVSVTSPITACASSHFAHSASASASRPGSHHRDHPLLALRDHDLPGLQLLAERDAVELDVDAGAVAGHLRE